MNLTREILSLNLREPFVSNKGNTVSARQVLVRLDWEGRTGLGTAVFAKEFGMNEATVQAALEVCGGEIACASPFELERVLARLEDAAPDQPTAVAAIDMALHDLLGKTAGLPLSHLLGLVGLPLPPTGLSLGALPEAEWIESARRRAAWPILKLKMTPATDLHSVARLREVYTGRLWVDGNGSWDVEQAITAAETLYGYGVELLEQPIPAGRPEHLHAVRERAPLPIVADEDCRGPQDVLRLQGCADVLNIKLLKCGGLRRALEMIRLARRAGMKVMLGCKTESVLGITAMAQLGGLADYLDLDGHLDLLDDPFAGIEVDEGLVSLPDRPGIGITEVQV